MKRFLLLFIALAALALTAHAEPRRLNGIVAIVNESVITEKEVYTAMADDLAFLERRYGAQPKVYDEKVREMMGERIEQLVEWKLILDDFKKAGFNFPDSIIEEKINKDIRTYGNRMTLQKTLQAKGVTFESYRTKTRERIIVEAMTEHFVPRNPVVSPLRMESYYKGNQEKFRLPDQVKLRMIVLTNQPVGALASPKKLGQEILAKLEEGAPFAELAKIYSQGSQASAGGDWGWVEKKVLREDLAEKAFAMKPGERSGLLETPGGFYIMLVEESRPSHIRPLSEVREEVEGTLKTEEIRRLHKQWIGRLKQKSFVRYF